MAITCKQFRPKNYLIIFKLLLGKRGHFVPHDQSGCVVSVWFGSNDKIELHFTSLLCDLLKERWKRGGKSPSSILNGCVPHVVLPFIDKLTSRSSIRRHACETGQTKGGNQHLVIT